MKTIFQALLVIWLAILSTGKCLSPVDSNLYATYDDNDLRKELYYTAGTKGSKLFKGSYEGSSPYAKFSGLTVDEVYLMRAECYARKNMITEGLNDLNFLMEKRWRNNGTFNRFTADTKEKALRFILAERRKELVYRGGLRWMDLRRLNLENDTTTLIRRYNNTVYVLPPNSNRYVLPIPDQEILLNPMQQNDR